MTQPMPVRVTRSGNSKVLPVPAELAREAHAEVGDRYTVERIGDDFVYHRTTEGAAISGTGTTRLGVVPAGRALRMSGPSSVAALDTWDF